MGHGHLLLWGLVLAGDASGNAFTRRVLRRHTTANGTLKFYRGRTQCDVANTTRELRLANQRTGGLQGCVVDPSLVSDCSPQPWAAQRIQSQLQQDGTFWMHSHYGLQTQSLVAEPLLILSEEH